MPSGGSHRAEPQAPQDAGAVVSVIAILITVMVLELPIPHGTTWAALRPAAPVLLTYLMSFAYLGIYWNNHHHMLQAANRVSGLIL